MLLSRAIRRSASPFSTRPPCSGLQRLGGQPPPFVPSSFWRRKVEPTTVHAQTITSRRRDAYTYPEDLNIFDAGWASTMSIGFTRVASTVFAGYGMFWTARSVAITGDLPFHLMPVYSILSTIPLLLTGLAFGGYVSHINVWLPPEARRSKEDLVHFTSHIPPDTILQLKSMWYRPWPHTQEVRFRDLRRLPSSWSRLANIELQPAWTPEVKAAANAHPFWNWYTRTWMGRFYIRTRLVRDRSRVSGVWDQMWKQIPMVGERQGRVGPSRKGTASPSHKYHAIARNRPLATRAKV